VIRDIADQLEYSRLPDSSKADLDETVRQVEALDRRALSIVPTFDRRSSWTPPWRRASRSSGQIDILIANAGIWTLAPFWEITEQRGTR